MASSDTIGRIISGQWSSVLKHCNSHQVRHLHAIRSCRTPALGGHIYVCNQCQSKHKRYNSCRNRHCPQCQKTQKYRWIEKQESKLLPCPYFHVVFTVPHLLNSLNLAYPRQLYTILFQSAWETLDEFGWNRKYLGAQLGATLVLHTWGSKEFKLKVILDSLQERLTSSQLAQKYELHPNQISKWKTDFLANDQDYMRGSNEKKKIESSDQLERLYAKIGRLEMENDYLKKRLS